MKQHITKKQWDELDEKHRIKWHNSIFVEKTERPTIGQMIEFLGDDLAVINTLMQDGYLINGGEWSGELCDCLWEAVKNKLN